jgi:gluconate 2-dehydrogenase alpha chain
LEPHFDHFEKLCGISGKAGNIRGQIVEGGNPFEGWRSDEYPNPPMEMTFSQNRFEAAARELGSSLSGPSANMSRAYTNPLGVPARALHLLRFLREVRLRQLLEGKPADDDHPGADAQAELHAAHQLRGAAGQQAPRWPRAAASSYVDAHGKTSTSSRRRSSSCAATSSPTPGS